MDAVLARMNPFGRIALCGMIAGYDGQLMPVHYLHMVLSMRLSMQGFIVSEHMEFWPQGLAELAQLVGDRQIAYRESIAEGLAAAPDAFIGMLRGKNFGKQLVKLI
jgi:NADPH-dependent curcumin reductase CurA